MICVDCNLEKPLALKHKDKYYKYCYECKRIRDAMKREKRRLAPKIIPLSQVCTSCEIDKPASEFGKSTTRSSGIMPRCKECISTVGKQYYKRKSEDVRQKNNKYYHDNKPRVKQARRIQLKTRLQSDIKYNLARRLQNSLYYALKRNEWKKQSRTRALLGCDLDTLKKHIESQFLPGMSWDNRDLWDIDHIIPLASAKTIEQLHILSHYRNLQPLWRHANRNIKKDKITRCWQKLTRDIQEDIDKANGMPFGLKARDFVLANENLSDEHSDFICKYEWLGDVPIGVKWVFTARYNNLLCGVVMVSDSIQPQFNAEMEALVCRGAVASWGPKNLNSRLLMFACRWLRDNTSKRIFLGYSDPEAGETGVIYKACNFDNLGNFYGSGYYYVDPDGLIISSRQYNEYKTKIAKKLKLPKDHPEVIRHYSVFRANCKKVNQQPKTKYGLYLHRNGELRKKPWGKVG